MTTDVSVTLSVVEGAHVILSNALREMSRQARHDRYHSSENKNLCKSVPSVLSVVPPDKLSFNNANQELKIASDSCFKSL